GRAGGGSRRGGEAGARARAGDAREVRRGLHGRAGAQLSRLPRPGCCAGRSPRSASRRGGQGVRTMKRHVVLIGLPGCGKTTVGRLAAETLHAAFVDIDAILARREGRPIALIFAERGQPAFREMERKEMEVALGDQAAIVAPGGGWAAQPGAIEGAKARALVVYLRTRPET